VAILLHNNGYGDHEWHQALSHALPEHNIVRFVDGPLSKAQCAEIEFAVIWDHPVGDLANYPNLQGVLLLGAGTERLDRDSSVPLVPIARLIDPAVLQDMAHYALYWVMDLQRGYLQYRAQQALSQWHRHPSRAVADFQVTVLGLGPVGSAVAQQLQLNGYQVKGWSKSQHHLKGIECFHTTEQLPTALHNTDVLINCLPLNSNTEQFIDAQLLSKLPKGASLISISRANVLSEQALFDCLASAHVQRAILDVFEQEPLSKNAPHWQHPQITVTPHISGATYARTAAILIAADIRKIQRNEQPSYPHQHPAHLVLA